MSYFTEYYTAQSCVVALWSLSHRLHEVCVRWRLRACSCDESSAQVSRPQWSKVSPPAGHSERIPPTLKSPVCHTWLDNGRLLQLRESESPLALSLWRRQWHCGAPVIVSGCHNRLDASLWHPDSFLTEFGNLTACLLYTSPSPRDS